MSETHSASMTRRTVLVALSATALMGQQAKAAIVTRRMNNVMIAVSDLNRSIAFYEELFGPTVRQGGVAVFRVGDGPHFFALTAANAGTKPGYLSYGLTVQDFDADRVMKTLADLGVSSAQLTKRGGTPEIFVTDPNGIKVQLQHTSYGYGAGVLGDRLPPAPSAAATPVFQLKTLNHVTLTITNGPRELDFYRSLFGFTPRAMQGTGGTFGIGEGTDGIVFNPTANTPNAVPGINHVCFTMENFDPAKVMTMLINNGFEPIENGIAALIKPLSCRVRWRQRANNGGGSSSPLGTPELYFTDPDNIPIQLQDTTYCGGSGALGQICP